MVFMMDKLCLAQKSNNRTPLGSDGPNQTLPGDSGITHMSVEVSQQNNGVPKEQPFLRRSVHLNVQLNYI